ncbi:TetR/AcrR family transcriptional regulator [Streptomyces sp. NPDC057806]|uniref:TetR/AcrR family transcriptional regulator n=1 Tax=Streptomyces sp. NPDC057806 TaxID=3346255 RepID=UPI003674BD00
MTTGSPAEKSASRGKRADAQRNREAVLAAAAEVFATSGVDAPIRQISAQAGVGMATIYRHFPTRADLITAVYRHQIEACAEAGPNLLAGADRPLDALREWVDLFVAFLVTKHGLADALHSDQDRFTALHDYFLDRLLPVCAELLDAAVEAGDIQPGTQPYELLRGIGNLCIGHDHDPRYDPRRMIALLLAGLQQPHAS